MSYTEHLMGLGVASGEGCKAIAGGGATGIVATGTTSADAFQLSAVFSTITTSNASTGVILPKVTGGFGGILNESGQTLTVYPPAGCTFNAAATSFSLTNTKGMLFFFTSSTTLATILTA